MTRGNQRELARQKNMKKQTDSGKGKRRDDGLSAAARKQRDSEIMQQKQKKAIEKKDNQNKCGEPCLALPGVNRLWTLGHGPSLLVPMQRPALRDTDLDATIICIIKHSGP
ncbi:small EDRK-rich factor 2-like [Gopherus evgoodei]|uniref:small EDRK-rich factor 2-like n=1 Tax=Gopherus evgoodei TaxID=1825980 RepID=UPI0011CF7ADB|nr:small EDRK-rich factor 2-like [Gopherus evgoodei]